MSEVKDPKIKLFGKTIELPEAAEKTGEAAQLCDAAGEDTSINQDPPCSSSSMIEENDINGDGEDLESNKNQPGLRQDDKEEGRSQPLTSDELKDSNANATPSIVEDPKALSAGSDAGPMESLKTEEDQTETSDSQDKTLKKPDKILPCPRCNSMDTKFCYFNNYNVNQPRHFCKNCQRYWTAGGTMRNVPVGAGRRKSKNAASQFRHLTVPDGLQNVQVDLPNGIHHPVLSPNGTVITFNSDTPLCESMVSVLNIGEKAVRNNMRNGFHRPEEVGIEASHGLKENGDDRSSGSSTTAASSKEEVGKTGLPELIPNSHPFPPQVPCFPGAPWPYPWHSVQWTAPVSPPNFPPGGFALPFYPPAPAYWGCAVPGPWNVPWIIPPTPSQGNTPPISSPNSPTLGKHSRDDNTLMPVNPEEASEKESNPKKCLWVPKTLRIDDPGEAAKSSIWATLGIKNERADSVGSGGLFKAFESQLKGGEKAHGPETSTVLQANPAALSRSLNFHESS
ncbi:hypothetical protein SASPL_123128 [Salvia splendens]|uniref:Dof-type domain-containing protein n=1 Tax=Salvia splendens TaxID=180675 RepID=A0A8X8XMM3_SALSN|nr:cyclic dof factor 2-like [Salvia splendens]KAG6415714.1 hypothetical protein SASPL_123128 [Salvia splendens]